MSKSSDRLDEIAECLAKGGAPDWVSVRELLSWFHAQRRGYWVVLQVREALLSRRLTTVPDFEYAYIDGLVAFGILEAEEVEEKEPVEEGALPSDPTYRIGKLASANKPPLCVSPDATLSEAITLMIALDYSQLPVMTNERDVKGMISWTSIGTRLALGKECTYVRDCMENPAVMTAETSLFSAIDTIVSHQYVLIRSSDKVICGIVTPADLSLQFRQLGEPFLLLGEIENHIRRIIQDKFTVEELAAARDPADDQREVKTVADLTFGEYLRLLENPDQWAKLESAVDRAVFIQQLEFIRDIRNTVMHFDPDGIVPEELDALRNFVRFLQQLAGVGAI